MSPREQHEMAYHVYAYVFFFLGYGSRNLTFQHQAASLVPPVDHQGKRPKKSLSLKKKLEIVKHHEGGENASFITRNLQLPQSSLHCHQTSSKCEHSREVGKKGKD
ncbi:hypothetical protein E2C01_022820 [Portunus trituberculatus]|uniref:Uncharacterized protein n=1 Tax=Portunus trituberculatus TaxID=210409 RepID=A0A5B7E841_PORTR|nr:hypothetical protein [Portunus trituberculatus]